LQSRKTPNPDNPFFKHKDRPLSSAYIQSFARALRAFSSWLYEEGLIPNNVMETLRLHKLDEKELQR
jgi:hypothetical protein